MRINYKQFSKIDILLFVFIIYMLVWPVLTVLDIYLELELPLRTIFYVIFFMLIIANIGKKGEIKKEYVKIIGIPLSLAISFLISWAVNSPTEVELLPILLGVCFTTVLLSYLAVINYNVNKLDLIVKLYCFLMFNIMIISLLNFIMKNGITINLEGLAQAKFDLFPFGGITQFLPSGLILALFYFDFKKRKLDYKIVNISFYMMLIFIILSAQRTSLIILFYILICFILTSTIRKKLTTALIGMVFLFFANNYIIQFFNETFGAKIIRVQEYEISRLDMWQDAYVILTSNITNFVFGTSETGLPIIGGILWRYSHYNPHSLLFYFWASGGIFAVFILLLVLYVLIKYILKNKDIHIRLFIIIIISYFMFAGFYFYQQSVQVDLLNIGLSIAVIYLYSRNKKLNTRT